MRSLAQYPPFALSNDDSILQMVINFKVAARNWTIPIYLGAMFDLDVGARTALRKRFPLFALLL
jgi:hypothetical protein